MLFLCKNGLASSSRVNYKGSNLKYFSTECASMLYKIKLCRGILNVALKCDVTYYILNVVLKKSQLFGGFYNKFEQSNGSWK